MEKKQQQRGRLVIEQTTEQMKAVAQRYGMLAQ